MIELISRGMLFGLVLAASGCTLVVNEGVGRGTPPPPPPPPRSRVAHQPSRAQAHQRSAPAVARPADGSPTGSLVITVRGGSCQIRVDTRSHGLVERLRLEVPIGSRVVTCQAPGGTLEAHTAVVHRGQVTGVAFDVSATRPRKAPPPPGGRPRL